MIMSLSFSQGHWYAGNLNKINEVSIDISVNGLEDPMWEKKSYANNITIS